MSGAEKKYKTSSKEMRTNIRKYTPYKADFLTGFDLRAYGEYVNRHQLKAADITEEIFDMFRVEA